MGSLLWLGRLFKRQTKCFIRPMIGFARRRKGFGQFIIKVTIANNYAGSQTPVLEPLISQAPACNAARSRSFKYGVPKLELGN